MVMVVAVVRKDHVTYARPSVLRQLHAAIGVYRLRTSHHVQEALKTSQRARQGSRSLCISISRCSSRWRGRGRDFNVSALAPGPACPAPLKRASNLPHKHSETLQELLLLRKYGKQQAGIDLLKLNQGEQKKKPKKKKDDEEADETEAYGLQKKVPAGGGEDERWEESSRSGPNAHL